MIVQCNNCHKKFDLDANLIPEEGRLLQCSACNNTWFFKKKKIETPQEVTKPEIQNNKEEETISPKNDDANSSEKPSNDEIENVEVEKTIEPLPDKKNYRILIQAVYTPIFSLSSWNNNNNKILRYIQQKLITLRIKLRKTL